MSGNLAFDGFEAINRRREARIANHFFIRFGPAGEAEDEQKIAGIVRDISRSGAAFLSIRNFTESEELDLEIELLGLKEAQSDSTGLLNASVVTVRSTVVRTESIDSGLYLVAVLFGPFDDEDSRLIEQAVTYEQSLDLREKI